MKIILKVILMAMCLFVAAFAFGFWPHLSLKSPANSRVFYSCHFLWCHGDQMPWVDHRSGGQFLSQKKRVKLLLYPYRNLNTWVVIGRIKKQHPIGETRSPNLQKTELSSKIFHSKNRSIICTDVKIAVPKRDR